MKIDRFKKNLLLTATLIFVMTASAILCGCSACAPKEEPPVKEAMFDEDNWSYMTVNGGAENDGGTRACSLDDGTIKFHNSNQAYDFGSDLSNGTVKFMLKGSKDWQMWFLADSKDNTDVNCYKLVCKDSRLYFTTSETALSTALAFAEIKDTLYKANEWNEFSLAFSTSENVCTAVLTIGGEKVNFAGTNALSQATVTDGNFTHTRSESFTVGNYICVKVWYGDCFLQLRSVNDKDKSEVLKIACLGDSITYGANADDSYTDSYPAQLQKLYGGAYNVMNFGKSGATVRDGADDPYRKTSEYAGAKLFRADIAIIMLGTNDSKTYQVPTVSEIFSAFSVLIDELKSITPNLELYIATSPYAYSSAYQINNANIEKFVVPAQKQIAEKYDATLVPMHEYTKNMSGNYADGIHPTSKGYTYIAYRFHCDLERIEPDEEYIKSFKDK